MRARRITALPFVFCLSLIMAAFMPQPAAAQQTEGGVALLSIIPPKVCVGDTLQLRGMANVRNLTDSPIWLPITHVSASAALGQVSPERVESYSDSNVFTLTYKATAAGQETLTLTLNNALATFREGFRVEEKCDYDAFLTSIMHLTADIDADWQFRSITHVTGAGTMKRDRMGSEFYQGGGTWHLVETVLTKPPECVEYYNPPLKMDGPFELDGRLQENGDAVDVILSFLPDQRRSYYHGETVCVDENGDIGTGWSSAQGGDPSLASKIHAEFPFGGGSQTVRLEGAGMDMVESAADVDYLATLTLIPR